jgi:hypothetical protein
MTEPRELTQAEIDRIKASPEKRAANAELFISQLLGHIEAIQKKIPAHKPTETK